MVGRLRGLSLLHHLGLGLGLYLQGQGQSQLHHLHHLQKDLHQGLQLKGLRKVDSMPNPPKLQM